MPHEAEVTNRDGQKPAQPENPTQTAPHGFCAYLHGFGLEIPKPVRVGLGFKFTKFLCGYLTRPISIRHMT
jgi:hypothetical protein